MDHGTIILKAVIAVTTDLGETFYPQDLDLVATVRALEDDGEIFLRRKVTWRAGSRSTHIAFDVSRQDVDWPACLHVKAKGFGKHSYGFLPPIADIWSQSLNPTRGIMDSGRLVERRFVSSANRTVSLLEEAGDSIARHLWDGSQALTQYIDQTFAMETPSKLPLLEYALVSATYRRLNVLELGCGCGTVGISLAQAVPDCDVLLTDLPEVEELVHANIARMNPAISSKVTFAPLDWEQDLPLSLQNRTNDLIIVSECTYNTDTLRPLVSTLLALTIRSPKAVIIVSTKTRHESEAAFFDMMRDAGLIEDGSLHFALPGCPGTGYADAATDVGLHVFRGREHRLSLSPRGSDDSVPTRSKRASSRRTNQAR